KQCDRISNMSIALSFLYRCFYTNNGSITFILFFFFFNDTATTEIYTLSLHDALPICDVAMQITLNQVNLALYADLLHFVHEVQEDRKSTRLNSSHDQISYAVFCLKKKKKTTKTK